eukprot:3236429-Prymnesium_polylepis.1
MPFELKYWRSLTHTWHPVDAQSQSERRSDTFLQKNCSGGSRLVAVHMALSGLVRRKHRQRQTPPCMRCRCC